MPTTRNIRNYGTIGHGSNAQDQATLAAAVRASARGDTITLPRDPGGDNTVLLKTNTPLFAGGTLAIDEGVVLQKGDGASGPLFNIGESLDTFLITLLSANGSNAGLGVLGKKAGRWGFNNDPATTLSHPHSQLCAFASGKHIQVEHMWAQMNQSTGAGGVATANQSSTAIFTYPGNPNVMGADDITIRDIVVFKSPLGYGPTQVQSGTNLFFYELWCEGGKTLRVEQDAGNLNHIQGLRARGIWNYHGGSIIALNPHAGWLHDAQFYDLTGEESAEAIRIVAQGAGSFQAVVVDGAALLGSPNGSSNNAQVRAGGGSGLQVNFVPGPAQEDDSGFTGSNPPAGVTLRNIQSRGYWELNAGHTPHFPQNPWPFGAGFGGGTPPNQYPKAVSGGIGPSGTLAKVKISSPSTFPKSVAGTVAPSGTVARVKISTPVQKPQLIQKPSDPSTKQAAFFSARVPAPANWRWQIDGGPVIRGRTNAVQDSISFPVGRGQHTVSVWVITAGTRGPTTSFSWLQAGVVVAAPTPQNLLGCGAYSAYVVERGGGEPIGPSLQWSELSWERGWSTPGAATITLDGLGSDPSCCRTLDLATPWAHELRVFRDSDQVWEGPITFCQQTGEQGKIEAMELSAWIGRRLVNDDLDLTGVDAADAMVLLMNSALSIDNPAITVERRGAAGYTNDKTIAAHSVKAAQEIGELIRGGVGYAMSGRTILAGTNGSEAVVTFLPSAFSDYPQADKDGLLVVNDLRLTATVYGDTTTTSDNVTLVGTATDADSMALYGIHQDLVSDPVQVTQQGLNASALAQVEANKGVSVTIDKGVLGVLAPVNVNDLVCGIIVDVRLKQCLSVLAKQRLVGVTGAADRAGTERIEIAVQTTNGVSEG